MNRLYYACYYAASALMLSENLDASTHKGIKTMLGQKFIQTGLLEQQYGRIYQQLFQNRQSGDYEDFVYCDKQLFAEYRPQADLFIKAMQRLIERSSIDSKD